MQDGHSGIYQGSGYYINYTGLLDYINRLISIRIMTLSVEDHRCVRCLMAVTVAKMLYVLPGTSSCCIV